MDRSDRPYRRFPRRSSPAEPASLDLVSCPECGAPAEVARRDVHASTDGPIEHVIVRCVDRHWFNMPAWMLPDAA